MHRSSFIIPLCVIVLGTFFAHTPANAAVPTNTTQGVFNAGTDFIKPDTRISGEVWGTNGNTFIVHLPNDNSGYNVLLKTDTIITKNGKPGTKSDLIKGQPVTVMGDLDTSTFTFSARTVALGVQTTTEEPTTPTNTPAAAPTPITTSLSTTPTAVATPTNTATAVTAAPATATAKLTARLSQGARNAQVTILQTRLAEKGFLSKNYITGYYGPLTTAAVKAFQKSQNLTQTGGIGPLTLIAINK